MTPQRETDTHLDTRPSNVGDRIRASYLRGGEKFLTNYHTQGIPELNMPPAEDYVKKLQDSGKYSSVRIDSEAAFSTDGKRVENAVAIFVILKPQTASTT